MTPVISPTKGPAIAGETGRRSRRYGTTIVCGVVAALVPHAFVAATLNEYVPGGGAPPTERLVVGKLALNGPFTLTRYALGAGPVAAGSQIANSVVPTL